jgi:hypothetical protein
MKALERYVKKSGKSEPYGETKGKGKWEGPKGVKEDDQYASASGKKVVEDDTDMGESTPSESGLKGYESVKGYGGKKKKRSYLSDD